MPKCGKFLICSLNFYNLISTIDGGLKMGTLFSISQGPKGSINAF
jgi:hypothetical protein